MDLIALRLIFIIGLIALAGLAILAGLLVSSLSARASVQADAMDFNEYLAMTLAQERLAEARVAAERARLLASAPAPAARRRVTLGSLLIGAGRWLVGAPAAP